VTWAEHAQNGTLPLDADETWRLDVMPIDTRSCLDFWIRSSYTELDALTGGDESKEQQLGKFLVALSTSVANCRERSLAGEPTLS
jgi:hypothetical protein